MTYRRRTNSDTWHWRTDCRQWPKKPGTYVERATKPSSGDLCNQCKAKSKSGGRNPFAFIAERLKK